MSVKKMKLDLIKLINAVKMREELYDNRYTETNTETASQLWKDIGLELGFDDAKVKHAWAVLRYKYHMFLTVKSTKRKTFKYSRDLEFLKPFMKAESNPYPLADSDSPNHESGLKSFNIALTNEDLQSNLVFSPMKDLTISRTRGSAKKAKVSYGSGGKKVLHDSYHSSDDSFKPPKIDDLFVQNYLNQITESNAPKRQKEAIESPIEGCDQIDLLFLAYAKTFKSFPKKRQVKFKVKLAQLVMDEEMDILNEQEEKAAIKPKGRGANQKHEDGAYEKGGIDGVVEEEEQVQMEYEENEQQECFNTTAEDNGNQRIVVMGQEVEIHNDENGLRGGNVPVIYRTAKSFRHKDGEAHAQYLHEVGNEAESEEDMTKRKEVKVVFNAKPLGKKDGNATCQVDVDDKGQVFYRLVPGSRQDMAELWSPDGKSTFVMNVN